MYVVAKFRSDTFHYVSLQDSARGKLRVVAKFCKDTVCVSVSLRRRPLCVVAKFRHDMLFNTHVSLEKSQNFIMM